MGIRFGEQVPEAVLVEGMLEWIAVWRQLGHHQIGLTPMDASTFSMGSMVTHLKLVLATSLVGSAALPATGTALGHGWEAVGGSNGGKCD